MRAVQVVTIDRVLPRVLVLPWAAVNLMVTILPVDTTGVTHLFGVPKLFSGASASFGSQGDSGPR